MKVALSKSVLFSVFASNRVLPTARSRRREQRAGNWEPSRAAKDGSEGQDSTWSFLDRAYINITGFPFPLGPYLNRKTIRYEVVKDTIWTFEQPQSLGFSSVAINIRMTVIRLKSGGLWVHAPIAPTKECLRLIKELDRPVEFIILPTFAYEHKIFIGPFSRKFPRAKVYVAPRQWSWPVNLPPQLFGIFPSGQLIDEDNSAPWSEEIAQKVFSPPDIGIGPYVECAFFHKKTSTLLVTDLVVYVPSKPLEVIPVGSLLDLARNDGLNTLIAGDLTPEEVRQRTSKGPVEDTLKNRLIGWSRNTLLVLYFQPFSLLDPEASFNAIKEKVLVSPVIRSLVYNSIPKACVEFVSRIEKDWKFKQIIPCHLAAPISARPGDLSKAFAFSYESLGRSPPSGIPLLSGFFKDRKKEEIMKKDNGTLDSLLEFLRQVGAVYNEVE